MRHHSVRKHSHCGGLMSTAVAACQHAALPREEQCVGRLCILLTINDKDAIISIHVPAQAFVRAFAPPRAVGHRSLRSVQELQVLSAEAAAVAVLQGPGSHIAASLSA